MAAEKGNNYYLQRSTNGRDKIFETPESVWEAFEEYIAFTEKNPVERNENTRNGVASIDVPRPYTTGGFCNYVDITFQTFRNYCTKESYKDFFDIFTRIDEICTLQNYDMGVTKVHDSGLVARKLGLKDKQEITGETTINKITEIKVVRTNKDK